MVITRKHIGAVLLIAAMLLSAVIPVSLNSGASAQPSAYDILDPYSIPQFVDPLVIPPAMPRTGKLQQRKGRNYDYYEIAVRQFDQQILPTGMPMTTVWSYGSVQFPGTVAQGGSFNYPAFTIETNWQKPVVVKWINDLVDASGNYLPHLLAVDQTLHWANPPGGPGGTDMVGDNQTAYSGPVPIVTHVHGAETYEWSDGYPEAWYLPNAANIPAGYATGGTYYNNYTAQSQAFLAGSVIVPGRKSLSWDPGSAIYMYPNDMRATTLWYHDHSLGMTRANVYAGPAGFYIIRGGPGDRVLDSATGLLAVLPGPAPALGDPAGMTYYEIPIVIQDRSFQNDGSLFYPEHRAYFEGLEPSDFDPSFPFKPDPACNGDPSDVSKIWQPEFFGNTMVVNGKTWPYLNVEPRLYRFRLLNGCNSRFLILGFDNPNVQVWQIGADGGYLPVPLNMNDAAVNPIYTGQLLMGPAERADVIVDFSAVPAGTNVTMLNLGPDEPFGGGVPDADFDAADPATTGKVMQFRVQPLTAPDPSTPPAQLLLPARTLLANATNTRIVTLNEKMSETVKVLWDEGTDNWVVPVALACDDPSAVEFGPVAALLGTLNTDNTSNPLLWMDGITETPTVGTTEYWDIYNFTADAHPIHVHLVQFEVVYRQQLQTDEEGIAVQPAVLLPGTQRLPESWETGTKDTVIVYPGEMVRIKATFTLAGLYVWHCHILEHEDNEMMRPYRVLP